MTDVKSLEGCILAGLHIIISLLLLAVCATPVRSEGGQKSDLDRIQDIHGIATLMEEHYRRYGVYFDPQNLEEELRRGMRLPVMANLSVHPLPRQLRQPPPGQPGIVLTADQLERYLTRSLHREIVLPRDDRSLGADGVIQPHFYQFLFDGRDYFVACYLEANHPEAMNIGDGIYKYTVGSIGIPQRRIRHFSELDLDR